MRDIKSVFRKMPRQLIKKRRQELNKKQFPSEVWFEKLLAENQFRGYKRNFPIGKRFFGDFVWRREKVVVEVDGPSHKGKEEYDLRRDTCINAFGLRVLRVRWGDHAGALAVIEELKLLLSKRLEKQNQDWRMTQAEKAERKKQKQERKYANRKAKREREIPLKFKDVPEIIARIKQLGFDVVVFTKSIQTPHIRVVRCDYWPVTQRFYDIDLGVKDTGFDNFISHIMAKSGI